MSITLTQLIDEVRVHLSDSSCQTSYFDDLAITQYINNALLTLWGLLDSDILNAYEDLDETNLVSGDNDYPLPDDYYVEYMVMYNGIPCRKVKYSEQVVWANNTYLKPRANQPAYTINGGEILLFPDPPHDAALGLGFYYLAKPPVLVDGTDTVDVDISYKAIISKLSAGNALIIKESVEEGKTLIDSALNDLKIITGKATKEEEEAVKQ